MVTTQEELNKQHPWPCEECIKAQSLGGFHGIGIATEPYPEPKGTQGEQ